MSCLNRAWSATAAGTGSGATATKTGVTGVYWVVTHVSGHTDTDSTLQLKDGATVLAEWRIDISLEGFQFKIPEGLWVASNGADVTAVLAASTSDCQVNIAGFGIG
jgi:hypothetical protein